ncbi:DUF1045 domain-containing protein [Hoeflea sp. Naph1]|uniref:DUF1045 domain-containing protein n=1 Tax=Hoeflea sp. Naph1 TaxID=3388653 RepID=UPI00398F9EDA
MRYAFYFSPEPDTELARCGASWLGRDAVTGVAVEHPELDGLGADQLAAITAPARRYGFHATLKAPFRLADDMNEAGLVGAMRDFAAATCGFDLPLLTVANLGGFVALVPDKASAGLQAFVDAVVASFEPYRAPLSEADIVRRNPDRLAPEERDYLMRWGYPYVFDRFRFHMTLSRQLDQPDLDRVCEAATAYFAKALAQPVAINALSLFVEPDPGAPFQLHTRVRLAPTEKRKTA